MCEYVREKEYIAMYISEENNLITITIASHRIFKCAYRYRNIYTQHEHRQCEHEQH